MFWKKSDHKKYYLVLSCSSFINKKDKYLYRKTARGSFLNATQNFGFHNEANCIAVPLNFYMKNQKILF